MQLNNKYLFSVFLVIIFASCGTDSAPDVNEKTSNTNDSLLQLTVTDSARLIQIKEINLFCESAIKPSITAQKENKFLVSVQENNSTAKASYIINNDDFVSLTGGAEFTAQSGNNIFLLFACNESGVSCKGEHSYLLKNYLVGNDMGVFNEKQEHLFYYLPKGEVESENVVLDFYLLNVNLGKSGSKIRTTIDGMEFLLEKWTAYSIEGLDIGEHSIRIELIDSEGNTISGPFNDSGERKFTVTKKAV
jgi:hypothetical protein